VGAHWGHDDDEEEGGGSLGSSSAATVAMSKWTDRHWQQKFARCNCAGTPGTSAASKPTATVTAGDASAATALASSMPASASASASDHNGGASGLVARSGRGGDGSTSMSHCLLLK